MKPIQCKLATWFLAGLRRFSAGHTCNLTVHFKQYFPTGTILVDSQTPSVPDCPSVCEHTCHDRSCFILATGFSCVSFCSCRGHMQAEVRPRSCTVVSIVTGLSARDGVLAPHRSLTHSLQIPSPKALGMKTIAVFVCDM